MSINITNAVWNWAPYKNNDLLVMLALADAANDYGICWPSLKAISKKARLTDCRGVIRHLNTLRRDGYLLRTHRPGTSTLSQLLIPATWYEPPEDRPPEPRPGHGPKPGDDAAELSTDLSTSSTGWSGDHDTHGPPTTPPMVHQPPPPWSPDHLTHGPRTTRSVIEPSYEPSYEPSREPSPRVARSSTPAPKKISQAEAETRRAAAAQRRADEEWRRRQAAEREADDRERELRERLRQQMDTVTLRYSSGKAAGQ